MKTPTLKFGSVLETQGRSGLGVFEDRPAAYMRSAVRTEMAQIILDDDGIAVLRRNYRKHLYLENAIAAAVLLVSETRRRTVTESC